jgi:hypothetical protein
MADITNLSNFLTDIANAIRTKKETTDTIAAEDFDTEILGITTGGSTETTGIKQFETEEEMQADPTAKEGDLAVVYKNEMQNMTATTHAQVISFPDTVILPEAVTSSIYCMLRGETGRADVQVQLTNVRFRLSGYLSTGSVNINYTSTDGITYTKSSTKDSVDFGTPIYCYYEEEWNDIIGYFMQVGGSTFDGLYIYKNAEWVIAPNQFTLTKSKMLPGVVGYGKNGVITGTDGIYGQLDYDSVNLQTLNKANEFELVQVGPSSMSITPSSSRKSALKDKDYFGFHNEIDLYNTPDFTLYTEKAINTSTVNLSHAYLDYDTRRIYAPVVGTSSATTRSFKMNVLDMDTGNILHTAELLDETDLSNATVYNLFKIGDYVYLPVGVQSSTSSKDAAVKLYKYDIANNKITIQYKVTTTTLGGGTTSGSYVGTVDHSGNVYALVTSSGGSSSTQILSKITLSGSVTRIGTFSNLTGFTRNFFLSKYIMFYDSTDKFFAYDTETNTRIRIPIDYSGSDSSGAPRTVKVSEAGTDTVIVAYFMNDLYVAIIDENKHVTAKYQDRTKVSNAEAYATDTVPSVYLETEKVCFVSGRYGMVCIDIENIAITTILELDEYNSMYDLKFHKNYVDYKSIRSNTLYSGKCLPIIVEPLLNSDFFAYKSNGQINVRPSDFARLFAESSSDGPISQDEYNTAVETANEILGEEV